MNLTPPPTPPWEGLHPLVVHFPIALLLFAGVFVLLAALVPKRGWWFSVSALILLIGGTAGAAVAVSTGEAARDLVEDGEEEMFDCLQEHEDLAEQARTVFVALTIVYAFIVFLPLVAGPLQSWKFSLPVNLIFLGALMGANLLLANAAHLGGLLVHQHGIRAVLAAEVDEAADDDAEPAADQEPDEEAPASAPSEPGSSEPESEGMQPAENESAPDAETEAPAPAPSADGAAKDA